MFLLRYFGSIGLLGYLFIGLFLPTANGQTMSNSDYIIQTQSINPASNLTTDTKSSISQLNSSISKGVNFQVKSGFDNSPTALPFSVSLSSDLTDFGALNPTNPIIRTVDLGIDNIPPFGYSIVASENNPLKSDKTIIPDTTCDNGQCSEENAGEWTNALTYGLGYRCDNITGADCDSSFLSQNFYKHFADSSNSQLAKAVMAGSTSQKKDVRLSYKVNIPGSQEIGVYTNIITFIAVPNF